MSSNIEKDGVKIKFNKERNWLEPTLADGTVIPFVTEVRIISRVGHLVKAQIEILISPEGLDEIEEVEEKEIVVKRLLGEYKNQPGFYSEHWRQK